MAGTVNRHWFISNAARSYPVDETATATDNDGLRLPDDILVDLKLKYPGTLGDLVFVSAVTVSANLVTVLVSAAFEASPTISVPVAAVSIKKPVNVNSIVAVTALEEGVGGWVVFGSGANLRSNYSGRFTLPSQSRLCPRAAQAYASWPIRSVGVLDVSAKLTGLVKLKSLDSNLKLTAETIFLGGIECRAIRLQLDTTSSKDSLKTFAGVCGVRPESGTCLKLPIESINGITPDCNGTITLRLTGEVVATHVSTLSGVVLESALSMDDVCGTQQTITDELAAVGQDECATAPVSMMLPPAYEEPSQLPDTGETNTTAAVSAGQQQSRQFESTVRLGSFTAGIYPAIVTWPSIAVTDNRIFRLKCKFPVPLGECGLLLSYGESQSPWTGSLISIDMVSQRLKIENIRGRFSSQVYSGRLSVQPNVDYDLVVTTTSANPMLILDVALFANGVSEFTLSGIGLLGFTEFETGVYGVLVDGHAVEFSEPTLE